MFIVDLKELILSHSVDYANSADKYKSEWKNAFKSSANGRTIAKCIKDEWNSVILPYLNKKSNTNSSSSVTTVDLEGFNKHFKSLDQSTFKFLDGTPVEDGKKLCVEQKLRNFGNKRLFNQWVINLCTTRIDTHILY